MKPAFCLLFCSATLSLSQAAMIVTNFDPVGGFDRNTGIALSSGQGTSLHTSLSFLPASPFLLTGIDFAASLVNPGDNGSVTVTLSEDAQGHPGNTLEIFNNATGTLGVLGIDPGVLHVLCLNAPALNSGETYWITLEASPNSSIVWNQNDLVPNNVGSVAEFSNATWTSQSLTLGAFSVEGTSVTSVPEPASAILLAASILFLFASQQKFRVSRRKI